MLEKVRGFEILSEYQGREHVRLPQRSTKRSAGYDLHAIEDVVIAPHAVVLVETGLTAYMQEDEWLGIYMRSGMSYKHQVMLANSVGVIDADYYGNPIKIMIRNIGEQPLHFQAGERVAQAIFQKYYQVDGDAAEGERIGGFGSTGR